MSDIIEKTYELLDALDNTEMIKNISLAKSILEKDNHILSLVKEYKNTKDSNRLLAIKKELYQKKYYEIYMKSYNELSLLVLKINKKYESYTHTKEHSCS